MASFIAQEALNNAVLFKLFELAQHADEYHTKDEVAGLFGCPVGTKRVQLAFEHWFDSDYALYFSQSGRATISRKGYEHVEKLLKDETSFFRAYLQNGDEWLAEQTIAIGEVPASDRIVSRSHNQATLEKAEEQLEVIVESLKSDNEVGDSLGDEKELILSEAMASKELVKSKSFRLSKLIQLVLPSLRYLAEKFGAAAIGEAAKNLITLLKELV